MTFPAPMSRSISWTVLVIGLALAGCASRTGTSTAPTQVASPTSTAIQEPTAPTTGGPASAGGPGNIEICRVDAGGGTYYLNITSADHDFSACAGAQPFAGTLEDLFKVPGVDRRCIVGPTGERRAIVGVYADTKAADLSAARGYCSANGGTDG